MKAGLSLTSSRSIAGALERLSLDEERYKRRSVRDRRNGLTGFVSDSGTAGSPTSRAIQSPSRYPAHRVRRHQSASLVSTALGSRRVANEVPVVPDVLSHTSREPRIAVDKKEDLSASISSLVTTGSACKTSNTPASGPRSSSTSRWNPMYRGT